MAIVGQKSGRNSVGGYPVGMWQKIKAKSFTYHGTIMGQALHQEQGMMGIHGC